MNRRITNTILTLYIPHGSDESASFTNIIESADSFISHMVQMKDKIRAIMPEQDTLLYIPHGSDER